MKAFLSFLSFLGRGVAKLFAWLLFKLGLWVPAVFSLLFVLVVLVTGTSFKDVLSIYLFCLIATVIFAIAINVLLFFRKIDKRAAEKKRAASFVSDTKPAENKKVEFVEGAGTSEVRIQSADEPQTSDFSGGKPEDKPLFPADNANRVDDNRSMGNGYYPSGADNRGMNNGYYPSGADNRSMGNDYYPSGADNRGTGNGYYPSGADNRGTGNGYYPSGADNRGTGNGYYPSGADNRGTGNGYYPSGADNRGTGERFYPSGADNRGSGNGYYPSGADNRGMNNGYYPSGADNRTGNGYYTAEVKEDGEKTDDNGFLPYNVPLRHEEDEVIRREETRAENRYGETSLRIHADEKPMIFRTRMDPTLLIYEYSDRLEFYRKTADGPKRLSVEYKSKN